MDHVSGVRFDVGARAALLPLIATAGMLGAWRVTEHLRHPDPQASFGALLTAGAAWLLVACPVLAYLLVHGAELRTPRGMDIVMTLGPAVLVKTGGTHYTATIDLNVSFLAPARPGPLIGEGRVLQLGRTVAFLEGQLLAPDGRIVARATASARVVPTEGLARD